jgi:hypothetical protein
MKSCGDKRSTNSASTSLSDVTAKTSVPSLISEGPTVDARSPVSCEGPIRPKDGSRGSGSHHKTRVDTEC